MPQPTKTTRPGQRWLIAKPDTADPYFTTHTVLHPTDTTRDDRPPTDDPSVRALDDAALDHNHLSGKWLAYPTPERIDDVWETIHTHVDDGTFFAAKTSTDWGRSEYGSDTHVLCIYTPNYFDTEDVFRVRDHLRDNYGFTKELVYKPDYYTEAGIYPDTAAEYDLDTPYRFTD